VNTFNFHPTGKIVVTGSDNGSWSLHETTTGKVLIIQQENSPVKSTEIHPDGLVIAVGFEDGKVNLYDIRT
jgi:pre-mRNA-processing factor 19